MKPTELLALLQELYAEKAALMVRHIAVARHVGNLDFNNTYQYVIAREETHLSWLRAAIEGAGGEVPAGPPEPAIERSKTADFMTGLIRQDARDAQDFTARWRPRIEAVGNARHRGMLRVLLGETVEHQRFFDQAVTGRDDLLGRRPDAGARRGEVVGTRWLGD